MNANGPMPCMNFAFPDVCLVPTPAGPIPTPFPNIALMPTAIPSQFKVLTMCMPASNLMTTVPISNGDNPGVAMGVASGMVMGPSSAMMGSTNVMVGGPPAAKMTMPAKQNGISPNTIGMTISPAQITVLVLR
ncbi:DUF4150 domain-containing protein [Bosea sp. BK604]|uniref:DUF4150 domain-containing protein n=1 Tax=Bosea sp. BK604 TaxID=2512180 RepID=UPI00104A266E|nr:DUF4150 domain-containing protein [Bosea sp. BK604]